MKLNLFSIPIYIGNIDVNKIKLENKSFEKTWFSKTNSSFRHSYENKLLDNSALYILNKIYDLINKDIRTECRIELLNIWENRYEKKDYQEKHIHPNSHFSFIIYKKIEEGKTVFVNPSDKIMISFYPEIIFRKTNFFEVNYEPKCKQGQIIIFPSFLEHLVQECEDSITISGNINIHIENLIKNNKVRNEN